MSVRREEIRSTLDVRFGLIPGDSADRLKALEVLMAKMSDKLDELKAAGDAAFQAITDTITAQADKIRAEIQSIKDQIAAGEATPETTNRLDGLIVELQTRTAAIVDSVKDLGNPPAGA